MTIANPSVQSIAAELPSGRVRTPMHDTLDPTSEGRTGGLTSVQRHVHRRSNANIFGHAGRNQIWASAWCNQLHEGRPLTGSSIPGRITK